MLHEFQAVGVILECGKCGFRVKPGRVDLETLPPCEQGKPTVREAEQVKRSRTAVVIPCHNYGRFLGECLDSVIRQTRPAAEIVVVDDSSTDDTQTVADSYRQWGVRYLRVDERHVWGARLAGLQATESPHVVFLDADDKIPARYIETAELVLADPEIGIAFSDVHKFGTVDQRIEYRGGDIERENWIHCAAMVRRAAILSVELPDRGCQTHADWHLWRALIRAGWRTGWNPTPLQYRRHGDAMLETDAVPYYRRAALESETVQIVMPLSGRWKWFPRLQEWFDSQTWGRVSLLVTDTSGNREFERDVRNWLAMLQVDTQFVRLPGTNGAADLTRKGNVEEMRLVCSIMPKIYNAVRPRLTSEYVFWVEDDVLPPLDAIPRLMASMGETVAAVSGVVPSRFEPGYSMTWGDNWHCRRGAGVGVERVTGTGFGCLLVRRSEVVRVPFNTAQVGHYDQDFALAVKRQDMRWLIDWSVRCWHQDVRPDAVR